ncbi:MAG: UDP-N-acetylmuramoyl-L-alanine--D-glutamate ligase [Patescibacteria group bacterium]
MLDFNNLKNKKVVVMGLGLLGGGVGVVKWLVKQGANVLITDLKTKNQLKSSLDKLKGLPVKYVLGKHREKDFKNADLIIKNPAVPRHSKFLKIARKNNIPIESDLSIFFRLFKGKIIGVTGTKGKSTTVSLLSHILKMSKKKFIFGGNIGQSPLNYLDKNYPLAVLEISSWQLEDMAHLKKSPHIACITTIFPDHLNTYKNFREYINSKKLIFKYQKKGDILVLNADDPIVKKFAKLSKAKVIFFSSRSSSFFLSDRLKKKTRGKTLIYCNNDILAAATIASILKIPSTTIKKAIKTFRGLPNRLEFVREKNGIKYYNDSTSTVPQSTILALNSFGKERNIILISGGADKKLDFKKMAREISKKCKWVILLPGTATKKIKKELLKIGYDSLFEVKTMKEAVNKANKIATRGDIVLLSPGCASFGIFQNAYDRGAQFVKQVKLLL